MPRTERRIATKLVRLYLERLAYTTARAEACGLKPTRFMLGATARPGHLTVAEEA